MSPFKLKTYVINLAEDAERKASVSEEISKIACLDPEWIEAVNGKKSGKEHLSRLFDYKKSKRYQSVDPTLGEVGCTLSHYECYNRLLASDQEVALIIEDDIGLDENAMSEEVLKEAFRYMERKEPLALLLLSFFDYTGKGKLLTTDHYIYNVYKAALTTIYLINKQAARLLVSGGLPYWIADDWSLFRRNGLHVRALYPPVAFLKDDSLGSTIGWDDRQKRKRRIPRSRLEFSVGVDECIRIILKKIGIIKHKGCIPNGK